MCNRVSECASALVQDIRCFGYRNLTLETSSPSSQSSAVASPGPAKEKQSDGCDRDGNHDDDDDDDICHIFITISPRDYITLEGETECIRYSFR